MTILNRAHSVNRPDPMYNHSHEYPLANVLHEGPNVSIRSVPWYDRWWVIALQLLVLVSAILCCIYEAGCFDR
jgi:hypothetical protein